MCSMMEGGKKSSTITEGVGLTATFQPRWFFTFTSNFVGTGLKFGLDTSTTDLYDGRFGVFVFISMKLGLDKLGSSSASCSNSVVAASVVCNVAAGGAA